MKSNKTILVTGASGLVGQPLCAALIGRGYAVRRLSRGSGGDFRWDVAAADLDASAVSGVDAVIHLAGETVAQRWTESAKAQILNSRVVGTQLLVDAILKEETRPAFISASGISSYGVDRDEALGEEASSGDGFLAEVTRQWEGAAEPLLSAGVRTVFMRTGIVLSQAGGALAKMLPPFRLGVGGRIGNGRQRMSWVSLTDLVAMYIFVLENTDVAGPINAVAPEAITNTAFTKILGRVLGRPTIFPLPAAVVSTLFGEMGRETILSDLAVAPNRLEELGFSWQHADLETALKATIHGA